MTLTTDQIEQVIDDCRKGAAMRGLFNKWIVEEMASELLRCRGRLAELSAVANREAQPVVNITAEHRRVIEMLLDICGAAFELADDSCNQDVDGEWCHVVPSESFSRLSDALDKIENTLPDELPNVVLQWSAIPRHALRSILTATSTTPTADAKVYAEIYRLRSELRGPDGFATWRDAAIAEKKARVAMEKLVKLPAPANAVAWEMRYWNNGYNMWHDWERITAEQHAEMSAEHATSNDYEFRVLYDAPAVPQSNAADWGINMQTGTPILVYKNCCVIESEQAHYVLSLINSAATPAPAVPDKAKIGEMPFLGNSEPGYVRGWNDCRAAMLAQPVSGGYKLVPVEPTAEMINAALASGALSIRTVYRAMLAAAPEGGNG